MKKITKSILINDFLIIKLISWLDRNLSIIIFNEDSLIFINLNKEKKIIVSSYSKFNHRNYSNVYIESIPTYSELEDIAKKIYYIMQYPNYQFESCFYNIKIEICINMYELEKIDRYYLDNYKPDPNIPF